MLGVVKWGILGLGKIAHKFASDLILVEGCQLTAVASSNLNRAGAFAKKFDVNRHYGSYEALYNDNFIDIIYVASLNSDHYKHVIEALKHGKSVLCEKPLAINQREVVEMIHYAQKHNVFLMEGLWTRFTPSFEQILKWIDENSIGKIRYINATFSFNGLEKDLNSRLFNLEKGGGSLLDIGIYPLFIAYQLMGMPDDIKSSAIIKDTGVDEQISIIMTYKQSQALLYSSFTHDEDMRARICGELGEIYIDSRWHESPSLKLITKEKSSLKTFKFLGKGYSYEIEEVNKCLRNKKKESSKWTLKQSQELLTLMDKIRNQTGIIYPNE